MYLQTSPLALNLNRGFWALYEEADRYGEKLDVELAIKVCGELDFVDELLVAMESNGRVDLLAFLDSFKSKERSQPSEEANERRRLFLAHYLSQLADRTRQ